MFPNPQDALPLPARPNLDQYKKRAKDLVKAANSPDPAALNQFVRTWLDSLLRSTSLTITPQLPVSADGWTDELSSFLRTEQQSAQPFTLARAQFILARIQGLKAGRSLLGICRVSRDFVPRRRHSKTQSKRSSAATLLRSSTCCPVIPA